MAEGRSRLPAEDMSGGDTVEVDWVEASILFADVVGSTSMGERLDPEDARAVVGGAVASVIDAVEAGGGTVVELAGDGVLAVFPSGPPAALAAAADAVHRVDGRPLGLDLAGFDRPRIRVGVDHGRVGRVVQGDGSRLTGEVIGHAVALEAAAPPGEVLVGAGAAALAPPELTVTWVGPTSASVPTGARLLDRSRVRPRPEVGRPEGSALPAWLREQRKVITALFAALVSVREAGRGEDDDIHVARLLPELATIVTSYGGRVKDTAGSGLVALFGAPVANEDDAERAVRAALAMVAAVESEDPLRAKIGLRTGLVVAGAVGAGAALTYGATGDTMNTAARIMAAAAPGEVLACPATVAGAGRHGFLWCDERTVAAKGKADPVVVTRCAGLAMALSARDELTGLAVLQGRGPHLRAVSEALAGGPGERRRVVIVGEAGMGKSALLARALHDSGRGRRLVRHRCASWHQDRLLHAAAQVLAQVEPNRAGRGSAPSLAELLLADEAGLRAEYGTADSVRAALRAAWHAAFETVDARAGLVIVEDLHWADDASRELLLDLSTGPALLVATSRTNPASHDEVAGTAWDVVTLGPLDDADARTVLEREVGRAVLPVALEERVLETAGGNPFVLHQLVRGMVEEGLLADQDGARRYLGEESSAIVPTSVDRIILARVDRLAPPVRDVLDAASVLGEELDLTVLRAMVEDDVDHALGVLQTAGLIEGGDHPAFANSLVAEATTRALLRSRRRELHARAASALGLHRAPAALLARHRWQADDPEAALVPAIVAADQALQRLSFDEARSMLVLAAEAAVRAGSPAAVQLVLALRLASTEHAGAWHAEARLSFAHAADLACALDDRAALATAALGYEDALFASRAPRGGPDDRSLDLLDQALSAMGPAGPAPVLARLQAAVARCLAYQGQAAAAAQAAEVAVAEGRRSGQPAALAAALIAWRTAHASPTEAGARLAHGPELRRATRASGDPELELEADRLLLMDELTTGAIAAADATIARLTDRIAEIGRPQHQWYPPMWHTTRLLMDGRFDEARAASERFLATARRVRYVGAVAVYAAQQHAIARHVAVPAHARKELDRMIAGEDRWTATRAAIAADRGDLDAARRELQGLRERPGSVMPDDLSLPLAAARLTEAIAAVGDRDGAVRVRDRLAPWAGMLGIVGAGAVCVGPADHHLGILSLVLGDVEGALEHFGAARRLAGSCGLAIDAALAAVELSALGVPDAAILLDEASHVARTTSSRQLARRLQQATTCAPPQPSTRPRRSAP